MKLVCMILCLLAIIISLIYVNVYAKTAEQRNTKVFNVIIPDERYVTATYEDDGKPYVCVFNEGIMALTSKGAFPWYLSLIIDYDNLEGERMPDNKSTVIMQDFCDMLTERLAIDKQHPNALFLGRRTGDGFTQMMWYVNNPELANKYLQTLIDSKTYPFNFEFQMSQDSDWEEAHYWLDPMTKEK